MSDRLPNWEAALSEYIGLKRHKRFEYGVNDCCIFAADAVLAVTGDDPISEYRGKYKSHATSIRALKEIGAGGLEKTIDAKFPAIAVGLAQRGDLAFYHDAVGVVMGGYAWFVSDDGLERIERSLWVKAWGVGHV